MFQNNYSLEYLLVKQRKRVQAVRENTETVAHYKKTLTLR